MTTTASEIKACCAASYTGAPARFLLGDTFHPGGLELTRRLLGDLRVGAAHTIVDVASGPGTSAILAARDLGCSVVGVELSAANVVAAATAALGAGVGDRVRFLEGDAESLPLADETADGALCECALCLFPNKPAALDELARVLRPGARLALSDVTAHPQRLPEALSGLAAWAACVADARPLEEIAALVADAGLTVERAEAHDGLLTELVGRVEARLRLARVMRHGLPADLEANVERALELVGAAREAISDGALGYCIVVARR